MWQAVKATHVGTTKHKTISKHSSFFYIVFFSFIFLFLLLPMFLLGDNRLLAEDKKSRNRIKDAYYLYFSQNSILLAYKQSRVYSLLPKILILFQANQSTARTFGAVLSASYTILWLKMLLLYYTTFSLVNCLLIFFVAF